jgi:hypothetical protein
MITCAIAGVTFLIIYIKRPYKINDLIVNSWLCLICVTFIGLLLGKIFTTASLLGFGATVSIIDIISFTKAGSKTPNAKIMANKNLMPKLIVYGKSFRQNGPVPTKGLGDFLFYMVLLSALFKVTALPSHVLYGAGLILGGCVINWIIVSIIYSKSWYKGFPATFIPFILISPLFLFTIR